jgi:hypothetical protein
MGMGRWVDAVARLSTATLIGFAMLTVPGGAASISVAEAASCPPPPVTMSKLVHLDVPGQHCYGDTVLTFRAWVAPVCDECGGVSDTVVAPRWLDSLEGSTTNLSATPDGPQTGVFVPPALGRCPLTSDAACPFRPYRSQYATVSARFDAPVAQRCRYAVKPAGGGHTKADAVAECQAKLVLVSVSADAGVATDTVSPPVAVTSDTSPAGSSPVAWIAAFVIVTAGSSLLLSRRRSSR